MDKVVKMAMNNGKMGDNVESGESINDSQDGNNVDNVVENDTSVNNGQDDNEEGTTNVSRIVKPAI